jgi:uncharacterized cupredoxin-like copper-binding protein
MRSPFKAIVARTALVAGAVVLFGGALATSGSATPRTITVSMRHSRFAPEYVIVRRGATVRFVITNLDPIDHEFILGDEAVQRRHETGTEPAHGHVPGEVSVPPGVTGETSYTFTRPGVLLIGCHAPGHYAYGMRGRVLIVY